MKKIIIFTIISLVFVTFGCKKDKSLDAGACSVSDEKVEASYSSATISGSFVSNGTVETMNVVYGEISDLKSANSLPCVLDGNSFSVGISDLSSATKYYYCFEFSNKYSSVMTDVKSFQTLAATIPTVVTGSISEITQTSAVCGGEVTNDGGAEVTVRGVCWSTTENPTLSDAHNTSGSGTGSYSANMPALTANTTYYVRAYAKNSKGTSYGEQKIFQTSQSATTPTVTTNTVSNITQTTAICGGNVTSDGGATVTARGVCWSTSQNPTTSNSHTTDGSGTGSFTSLITGLTANTTYYVRAYATNSAGTSYGKQKSFMHSGGTVTVPTVTTNSVSNITQTTATCGGNVTSDGGATVTARGVCWSISQNPTTSNSHTTNGSGTGTFTSSMTGLTANTTYYVRAYATNNAGTSYGEEVSFTTSSDHEYVDLGLPSGLLWATCNVGAENPEDYGNYYAWGETTTKSIYSWTNYQWCNGTDYTLTKYCTNSSYGYNGFVDNKTVLEMTDDAANANWGGDWRMPTYDEMEELENNCTWTWTTQNGKNGRRVTGPNGNSIFLPAAGYYYGSSLGGADSRGNYWSSSLDAGYPGGAYGLGFDSSYVVVQSYNRYYGRSVRPVCPPQN